MSEKFDWNRTTQRLGRLGRKQQANTMKNYSLKACSSSGKTISAIGFYLISQNQNLDPKLIVIVPSGYSRQ